MTNNTGPLKSQGRQMCLQTPHMGVIPHRGNIPYMWKMWGEFSES